MGLLTILPLVCSHGHMFCDCLPTEIANLGDMCALSSPLLHQLTMQFSFWTWGSSYLHAFKGECVDATMKGPSKLQ